MRPGPALLLAAALSSPAYAGDPLVPAPDFVLLDRAAQTKDPALANLRRLRAVQIKDPRDAATAAAYAQAAIAIGRTRGDPRYFGYARAVLAPWLDLPAPPPAMRLLRATLAQRDHRFAEALADLDALIAADPGDGQARLTRAVILMVQGRARDAGEDCSALSHLGAPLVAVTCAGEAASLLGQARQGQNAIVQTFLLRGGNANADVRLWSMTLAAEIAARRGDAAAASRLYRGALGLERASGDRDVYLHTAYADFLLEQGDNASVVPLLAPDTAVDPLLLRLVIAERALASPDFERHRAELRARYDLQRARGETLHLRDESRLALDAEDAPAHALALALQNWETQREPADARLVLRAARAAGDPSAAAPVLAWMKDTGIEDPALHAAADALENRP